MSTKKSALGKGLSALLENADTDVTSKTGVPGSAGVVGSVAQIQLDQIEANPFQPRVDFDKEMLKVLKSVKDFQATPVQEIWHNDGDQVLAYERKDLIFVFNFNPKQSFTDYGFLVTPGAYEVILNTDDVAFGGNGLADDSVVHFTITDPLYKKEKKEWLKLYIPARTAVVLRKKK